MSLYVLRRVFPSFASHHYAPLPAVFIPLFRTHRTHAFMHARIIVSLDV